MGATEHPSYPDLGPRYRAEGVLGAGAMSVVYAGVDVTDGRSVAIKVVRAEVSGEVADLRFLREARLERALGHPRIVSVLDTGVAGGRPFSVMPLLEGETLRARLRREVQLPLDDVVRIVQELAEALDHAHANGVVHRDVKPENVMLTPDGAVLMDLGIAYALDVGAGDRLTGTGIAVGTPYYMSPEQGAGERTVDARTDVYALGCVAYEMLAGEPPFTGAAATAVRARHALEPVPSLRVVRPALPPSVDDAVRTALAKSPADRTPGAGVFARQLREAALERTRSARSRSMARRAAPIVALATLAVALVAIAMRRGAAGADAPVWVLIGDVVEQDSSSGLGAVVREMVASELQRSRALAIVPPEQVRMALASAGLPDSARLTLARAREVAVRTAVRALVAGEVRRVSPTRQSVSLVVVNAEDGAELLRRTATVASDGTDLERAMATMAEELRRTLGERSAALRSDRVAQVVHTPSFEAFRSYADALDAQRRGNYDGAIHLLRRAVATDTAFAAAWSLLAMTYVAARQPDSANLAFARARAHEARLTPAERDRLQGDVAYNVDRDLQAAATAYQRYLEQRPVSIGGWNNLGLYLSALGRHEDALAAFERALRIDPLVVGPRQIQLLNIAAELVVLERRDSARVVLGRLQGPNAQYVRLMLLNADDDWATLAREASAVADAPTTERFVRLPAQMHAAGALAALGDVEAADRRLADAIAAARGADLRSHVHARLLLHLAAGRTPAWPLPEALRADTTTGASLARGVHAALRSDLAEAERRLAELDARGPQAARQVGHGRVLLSSLIAARRRAWSDASAIVPVARRGEHDPFSVDRPSSVALRALALIVLEAQGRRAEADSMRALLRRAAGLPPSHFALRGFVMRSP